MEASLGSGRGGALHNSAALLFVHSIHYERSDPP
jgi:hypothetical protein